MVRTINVTDAAEMETPQAMTAKRLHDSEHAQVVHVELAPGEGIRKHTTPVDVVFYILEGRATVEIGDEIVTVDADTLVESPANSAHRVINVEAEPLRFLVIKTPRPTESPKML
jgi:mannose-6-phosphate isomerase-like protein (cupin superfamily)